MPRGAFAEPVILHRGKTNAMTIRTDRPALMTIDRFNRLTGHDTLHPLICMVDLPQAGLDGPIRMECDFYGLLYCASPARDARPDTEWLRLVRPGETVELPLAPDRRTDGYSGVLFHPDLLCDTPLEARIETYPGRCRCRGALSERERRIIADNLREIGEELHHAIDRHSASIIVAHIELLLNYCVRFCNQ